MSDSAAAAATASVFARDSREQSVLVADGYGLALTVDRGHLLIRDGLGKHRRERRLPRAQREVQRIVVLGHTGHVSLEAVRWCTDTGIALLQIDTDGRVLLTAAAPGKDDPRLRRAQAAAPNAPVGLEITRALLGAKLAGQTTRRSGPPARPADRGHDHPPRRTARFREHPAGVPRPGGPGQQCLLRCLDRLRHLPLRRA